ncbi:MAG: hypothetical protein ACYCSG_05770 [Thermoplasmataceae archaeon]
MYDLSPYLPDLFFFIIGLSIILDLIILTGTIRALRIRRVRILYAVVASAIIILAYLVFLTLNLLGYVMIPPDYAGVIFAFSVVLVFYYLIVKEM